MAVVRAHRHTQRTDFSAWATKVVGKYMGKLSRCFSARRATSTSSVCVCVCVCMLCNAVCIHVRFRRTPAATGATLAVIRALASNHRQRSSTSTTSRLKLQMSWDPRTLIATSVPATSVRRTLQSISITILLSSSRRRLSYDDCLEDKRETYQNCSLLCCT